MNWLERLWKRIKYGRCPACKGPRERLYLQGMPWVDVCEDCGYEDWI